jgi:hypothetical protein
MEECYICFSSIESNSTQWKTLSCSHKLCYNCYVRLDKCICPLCRKTFKYSKEDIIRRRELNIDNKYSNKNSPSPVDTRLDDISAYTRNNVRNRNNQNNIDIDFDYNIGIVGRQRYRKRRKNLTEEEVKERRELIRKRCRAKFLKKENRLSKINWYDINV